MYMICIHLIHKIKLQKSNCKYNIDFALKLFFRHLKRMRWISFLYAFTIPVLLYILYTYFGNFRLIRLSCKKLFLWITSTFFFIGIKCTWLMNFLVLLCKIISLCIVVNVAPHAIYLHAVRTFSSNIFIDLRIFRNKCVV